MTLLNYVSSIISLKIRRSWAYEKYGQGDVQGDSYTPTHTL